MSESSSHCKDSDRPLLSDAAMIEESAAGVDGSSSKNDDGMDRKEQSTTMPTSHEQEKKKSDKSIKARSEEGSIVSPPYFIAPVDGLLVTNKPLAWEMKATLSLGIGIQTQGNRSDMMERADEKSHIDVTSKKKDDSSNINGESIHTIDATDEKADVAAAASSSSSSPMTSLHLHLPLLFSLACKISAKSVEKKTNEYVNVQTVWLKAKRDGEATIEHGKGRNRKEEEKGEDEQGKRKVEIKSRSENDGSSGDDKLTDASGAIVKDDEATAVESNDANSMMSHPVQPLTTSVAAGPFHTHPHSHPPLRLMQQIRPATSYSSGSVSALKGRIKRGGRMERRLDAAASMNTLATMDGSATAAATTADIKTEHDDEASMKGGVSVSAATPSSISAITSAASSSPSASPSAPLISSSSRIQRRAAMHATRINADIMKGKNMNDIKRAEMEEKNGGRHEKGETSETKNQEDDDAPFTAAADATAAATMNISPVSASNSIALPHQGNDDDVMSSLAAASSSPVELLDEEKDRTIGTAHIITKKPCNDADGSMDAACMTACQTVIDKMRRGSEGSNIDAESLSHPLQPLIDSLYVTVSPLSPGHGVADDVGFLTHVTTKGGISAKRQKQKYILFQSGFPYCISLPSLPHPFHLTVHRLQLRSWIWEVKPIKILNMTNNAASSSESSSPLLPVVPLIHMMTMQQKASHRHHHASNNTFNGVSASRPSRSAKSPTAASKKRKRMKTEDENEVEEESWTPNAAHNQSGKRMMKGSAAIVEGRSATSSASSIGHHGSVSSIRSSSTGRLMRSSAIAAAAAVRSILTYGSSQDEYAEYGDGTEDGDPTSPMHASDSPVAAIPLFKRSLTTLIHATETVKGTKVKDGKKQNESAETDTTKKGNSSKHSSVKSSKGGNESKRRHIDNGNPTATTKMDDGNHRSNHASAAYPSGVSRLTREKKQQRKTTSHVGLSSSLLIAVEQARAEDGNANISVGSRSWSKKKTKKDDRRGKKRKQQTILTVAGIVAPPSTSIPSASIIQPAMKNKKKRRQIKSKSKVMHPVDLVRSNAATAASSVSTQQQSMSYSMAMMDDAATSFPMGVNMSMNGMNGDMMQSSASSSLDEMSRMHSIGGMSGMQLQPFMSHHQLFSMPSAAAAAAASPLHSSSSAFTSLHTTAAAASVPMLLMMNSHGSPDGSSSRSARTSLHTNILSPLPAIDRSEHVQNGGSNNSYVTTMTRDNHTMFRSICHPAASTASMPSGAADESTASNQSKMPTTSSIPLQRPQPIRPSCGNGSRHEPMINAAMSGRESGSDCHTPGAASISAGMLSTPKFVASPSSNTFMSGLSPSIRSSTSPAVPSARGGSAASSLPPLPPSSSPARGTGIAFSPYRSSAFSSYLAAGTSDGDGASVSQRLSLASSSPPTALSAADTTVSTGLSLNSASPVLLHGMTAHAQRSEPTPSMSRNIGNGNGNVSVGGYDGSSNTNVSVISIHATLGLAKLARRLPIDGLPPAASVNGERPNVNQSATKSRHHQQPVQRNNMVESFFSTLSPAAASTPSSALMTHAAASMTTADHSSPMHDMSSSNHPVASVASIHDASSFHVDGTIVEEGDE